METTELDILLDELETRVERLRALYEQYFLGIEKIPPHVAHKDVDRRLYRLRREPIRNTARRFKLQTIIQRYNTFQQYWMRIMREIENGTYRRHVLRAERTVGITDHLTAAERKRLALPERDSHAINSRDPPPERDEEFDDSSLVATNPAPPSRELNESERAAPPSITPADSPSAVRAQIERDLGLLLDDDLDELDTKGMSELGNELDDPLLSSMPPPLPRKASAKPIARRSSRPGLERRRAQTPRAIDAALLDPPPASEDAPPSAQSSAAERDSLRPSHPLPGTSAAAQGGLRLPAFSAVAGRGLPPLPRGGLPRGAPKPASTPIAPVGKETAPSTSTDAPSRPTSGQNPESTEKQPLPKSVEDATKARSVVAAAAPATARAEISANEATQTSAVTRTGSRESSLSSESRSGIGPEDRPAVTTKSTTTSAAKPQPVTGGARGHQLRPTRRQPDGDGAARDEGLERRKVEHLAEKLRSARLQTNESLPVSVDALAKKLQATAAQLRKKHQGRQIDFDIVIKDGKAIVKPIVR